MSEEEKNNSLCTKCKKRQSKYRKMTEEGLCEKCDSKTEKEENMTNEEEELLGVEESNNNHIVK